LANFTIPPHLDSELQLLLLCCQNQTDPKISRTIQTRCATGINWDVLIQKALSHGILPLVYQKLTAVAPGGVPLPVMHKLKNHYKVNARQSFLLSRELIHIIKSFDQAAIKAVAYKGPLLAELTYGDLALRQSADLDILITKPDLPAATDILTSRGYQPDKQYQLNWEAHFINPESRFVVDLHWGVTTFNLEKTDDISFELDLKAVWKRVEPADFLGLPVHTFAQEDLLMIRCQDAVKEFWKDEWPQLKWVVDIDRIVEYYLNMDWPLLVLNARQQGNLRLLYLCLSLAKQLVGTHLPPRLVSEIQNEPRLASVTKVVIDQLRRQGQKENRFLNPTNGFILRGIFCIKLKDRFSDKIIYLRKILKEYYARMRLVAKLKENRSILPLPRPLSFLSLLLPPAYVIWHLIFRSHQRHRID